MSRNFKAWIRKSIPAWVKRFVSYSDEVEFGTISFSQFGEDMILRNLFLGKKDGFYVDVGAHDPIRYSNTYYFYKQGWSGIVIDPLPGAFSRFAAIRPRDIALSIGISDEPGELQYYCFSQSLYNTFSSEQAGKVEMTGNPLQEVLTIPVRRLDDVLECYLPKGHSLDLLSIDAEGYDLHILRSNNWVAFKPKTIVVENLSIDPSRLEQDEICKFLNKLNYSLVGFTHMSLFFKLDN